MRGRNEARLGGNREQDDDVPLELRLLVGVVLSAALVYTATPLAIKLATRWRFYDEPIGYKGHAAPTPYLGGSAVIAGFVAVMLLLAREPSQTLPVVGGVVVLWLVGTIDDRRAVSPLQRVAIEVALAAMLWGLDLGWSLGLGPAVDLLATCIWVVAVVNAFNLFDNMDGATSTMALVIAGAIAVLGAVNSDVWLAVAGAALCGACLGFLPHNLSRPSASIFLGDGGSMPIGFAVAALVMVGASSTEAEWQALAMGLLLVGVPALDTALVVVSRRRRGLSVMTAGRDHLTHRAHPHLRTARSVALALGSVQALLAALALVAASAGSALLVVAVLLYLAAMTAVIVVLDAPAAAGAGLAGSLPTSTAVPLARPRTTSPLPALALIVPLGIAIGLSPFAGGYYDSAIWVPVAVGVLMMLIACVVARPMRLTVPTTVALTSLGALALWALTSAAWTDSIEQAVVEGNRLVLYAAALGVFVLLLRSDRRAQWLLGAFVVGALVVAAWVTFGLVDEDASLFLGGRLHEPLGYINGQASLFALALWPCIALAEQKRSAVVAGLGLAAVTLFASLIVLSQSRGAVLAAVASLIVMLALLPGRLRRVAAALTAAACLAPALPTLLHVYGEPSGPALRNAGLALLLSSAAAGTAWTLAVRGARLVETRGELARQRLRRALARCVGALALGAAVFALANSGSVSAFVDRQYSAFVTLGGPQGEPTASRLASGAGNRYDYWRIAGTTWREHPIVGVGAGGYDKPYFLQRTTTENVRQPHSLPLQLLAELGLVGALLLAALFAAVAAAARRRIRALSTGDGTGGAVLVAACGTVTVWLVHASVDWIALLPGLTVIAIACAAVLLRPADPPRADSEPRAARPEPSRPWARIVAPVAIGVAITLAAVSLTRQGLSELYAGRAQDALVSEPSSALREANRALRLDREAVTVYYTKAAALARFGAADAAQSTLLQAASREPRNFVTWTLLGDLQVRQQNLPAARRYYRRAAALNPGDPGIKRLAADPRAAAGGPR